MENLVGIVERSRRTDVFLSGVIENGEFSSDRRKKIEELIFDRSCSF